MKKAGNPLVLMINQKAKVFVQDAEAHQELLERIETVQGLYQGLADVEAGRTSQRGQCSTGCGASMPYRVEAARSSELRELNGELALPQQRLADVTRLSRGTP